MALEATINSALIINSGNLVYHSQPNLFRADLSTPSGPSPGAIQTPTTGVVVDFEQLTTPGLARLMNLDSVNYVEYGVYDPATDVFYPLGEILPGETYVVRFSRNLRESYLGTGTSTSPPTKAFMLKSTGGTCTVLVEAFEA